MPALPPPLADLVASLDARLVEGWIAAVSVPTARTRRWLRGRRLAFADPEAERSPSLIEIDATARVVIERYGASQALVSGAAGLGGAASLPPELLASLVASLRLGQRLCVVYGFDPETDRGQMALWRAMAAGHQVDLPDAGPVGVRASEVPGLLLARTGSVGGTLARSVVKSASFRILRFTRLVPLLASATGARAGRRSLMAIGERMQATLRRLADAPATPTGPVEEAIEIRE